MDSERSIDHFYLLHIVLDAMMWENVTPFQVDKLWSQVVHYYIDKKKMSKEEANRIAAAVVKKEIEKNTCQNIACRHLKSKHLGDKRQCMVTTCPCSEFVKKE